MNDPTTAPTALFSVIDAGASTMLAGLSFTFVTVTVTALVAVSVPSLTCTVTS